MDEHDDRAQAALISELFARTRERLVRCTAERDIEILLTEEALADTASLAAATMSRRPDGEVMIFGPGAQLLGDNYFLLYRHAGPERIPDLRAAATWVAIAARGRSGAGSELLYEVAGELWWRAAAVHAVAGARAFQAFQHGGDDAALDTAIDQLTLAVDATPQVRLDRSIGWMQTLASALNMRFAVSGGLDDIVRASAVRRAVVAAVSEDDPNAVVARTMLASGLIKLMKRTRDPHHLDEAVAAARWAAERTPTGAEYRAARLARLAEALVLRFLLIGDRSALAQAVDTRAETVREALSVTDADTAAHVGEFVSACDMLVNAGGGVATLDVKAAVVQDLVGREGLDASAVMTFLGNTYYQRYEFTGDLPDLERSIQVYGRVVELSGDDGAALSNLSNALRQRSDRRGSRADLDEAIELAERAVSVVRGRPEVMALRNLAIGLLTRYRLTKNRNDLDAALVEVKKAVELVDTEQPHAYVLMTSIAMVLGEYYEATRHTDDLEKAITWSRAALDTAPPGTPGMAAVLSNASALLLHRFEVHGRRDDLDESVQLATEAVGVADDEHLFHWISLRNYGKALEARYRTRRNIADLGNAVNAYRRSAALAPVETGDAAGILALWSDLLADAPYADVASAELVAEAWNGAGRMDPRDPPQLRALKSLLRSVWNAVHSYGARGGDSLMSSAEGDQVDHPEPLFRRMIEMPLGFPSSEEVDRLVASVRDTGCAEGTARAECLAVAHELRFQLTGDDADLEAAIALHRDVLATGSEEVDGENAALVNLAAALLVRFRVHEEVSDLETALVHYRRAVDVAASRFSRASAMVGLLSALELETARTHLPGAGEEADSVYGRLLEEPAGTSRGDVLARLLYTRLDAFRSGGDIAWLEAAIDLCDEADLEVHSDTLNPVIGPYTTALRLRYWERADVADIQKSVALCRDGLGMVRSNVQMCELLHNLGVGLRMRFDAFGEEADLEGALSAHRRAFALEDLPASYRTAVTLALSNSLFYRSTHLDDRADLEQAISLARECVKTAESFIARAESATALATGLLRRFSYSRREADLDELVRLMQEVTTGPRHADRGVQFALLGDGLLLRHEISGEDRDLGAAIDAFQTAVGVFSSGSPRKARNQGSLPIRCTGVT
ncbi:tetratricopeptide repeat protein [Lentzea sp. CA-135723]|uniref:tetratricopeptide repeat protein n=1 Tax=Lentzea sp. CA-135723 TaxID=3239950 RepID=UPI003D90E906